MSHIKKRFQFQKVIEDYNFMKQLLEKNEENENSDETVLLLNSEDLNYEKCEQIFCMLRHTLTLQTIVLKSEGNHSIINEITKPDEAEKYEGPIFYTKYALKTLYQAITDYLYNSDRIKIIALKNIPITTDLPILCQGIRNNRSIRVLNFEDCEICDDGCIQICQALRKSPVESLGLENCKISLTGASWLAWLIREQSMLRTLTTWNKYQNSYEYKTEQGIRKMIINNNPEIKDSGAKFIIGTLFEDNWLTHIHMQNTGLSDVTVNLILRLLKQNKSLTVFDITRNHITSTHNVERIAEALIRAAETDHNIKSQSVKRNTRNKKKNMKKSSFDKALSDKAQQTSEYSLYCEPFILINPKIQNEKFNDIYSHKQRAKKCEDIQNQFNKIFNDSRDKVKPPAVPKVFNPLSHLNSYSRVQCKFHNGNEKDLEMKNRLKFRRPATSVNINSAEKKEFRLNESVFLPAKR